MTAAQSSELIQGPTIITEQIKVDSDPVPDTLTHNNQSQTYFPSQYETQNLEFEVVQESQPSLEHTTDSMKQYLQINQPGPNIIQRQVFPPVKKYKSGYYRYRMTGENEITDYKDEFARKKFVNKPLSLQKISLRPESETKINLRESHLKIVDFQNSQLQAQKLTESKSTSAQHNFKNQLLYTPGYKQLTLPKITFQEQQISYQIPKVQKVQPKSVSKPKLPTEKRSNDKIQNQLRAFMTIVTDIKQQNELTYYNNNQIPQYTTKVLNKPGIQNRFGQFTKQADLTNNIKLITINKSVYDEASQLKSHLTEIINNIDPRNQQLQTIKNELSLYKDKINVKNNLKSTFNDLSNNAKQIVRFLMQPQINNMSSLGNYKNLINQILSYQTVDNQTNNTIETENKDRQVNGENKYYFDLLQQIQMTGKYPDNFMTVFENKNTEVEQFFIACQNDEYHLVGSMLENNKLLVTERNHKLETGLHIAIREQSSRKLCELLLKFGSDVHTTDLNGDSCIDLARQRKKDKELIKVILNYS